MELHKSFRGIIGQSRIKNMFSLSAAARRHDGEMISTLIQGPAGLGKTKVALAYVEALQEEMPEAKVFILQPDDFRLIGETFNQMIEAIVSGEEFILFLDECHELKTIGTKQHHIIFNYIRKALDNNNKNRPINVINDQMAIFNRRKQVIILATNFPHLLDSSGAFQSRITNTELDLYTEKELMDICVLMGEANGFLFKTDKENDEDPVRMIARCGRGTARFMERIMEQLQLMNDGTKPVTEKQVLAALKNLKFYPRGLHEKEIMLLGIAATTPINRNQFIATSQIEPAELRNTVAYLTHPDIRFINSLPNGTFETTRRGKIYLTKCKNAGFDV